MQYRIFLTFFIVLVFISFAYAVNDSNMLVPVNVYNPTTVLDTLQEFLGRSVAGGFTMGHLSAIVSFIGAVAFGSRSRLLSIVLILMGIGILLIGFL